MSVTDCQFPHIKYDPSHSPKERGLIHGESFRQEIKELAQIRRDLMLMKNPALKGHVEDLAKLQALKTRETYPKLFEELQGIQEGSVTEISDLIILNNYTDFRDITLADEGCTCVGVSQDNSKLSGQTWDMHSSAKNYVCTIEMPGQWIAYSLVGCLGMMGMNAHNIFIGVNNINTINAVPGIIWSALIRDILTASNFDDAKRKLLSAPVSSGHNYLLSDGSQWENWEMSPHFQKLSGYIPVGKTGVTYHTNHCLNDDAKAQEEPLSRNSTSFERFSLIEEKGPKIRNAKELLNTFQSHDGYPKSICGHYQSGVQDPSITCGGGVFDHLTKTFTVWRGCKTEDQNYRERTLKL